ncbi:MAG TPA: hypothetical protein VFM93_03875 [Candidatus Limnocylindria bacterium]|nr:hypothetical protein [Candidatus Limnocylindria bacterium]
MTKAAAPVPDAATYEKLGQLYLGAARGDGGAPGGPLLYDSRDLVTHAVCVGMTGSGKTGLCIALLEEAALDGVPAIAIDPKGDVGNLLLTFPDLRPEDFRPWVLEEDAARAGITPDELAKREAERWRAGLAEWGQDGERIRRLRDAADLAVYTPASTAGIGVSILRSFAAPPPAVRDDRELLRERVAATVTGLLTLLGIEADPVRSREHMLVSQILTSAWLDGTDLDLAGLIAQVDDPPFDTLGAMPVDRSFPKKDREAFAVRLNGLVASPTFQAWLEGVPLDVESLLRTRDGKPRVSVISIAHLPEAERMFFVTLLLGEVLAWTRARPGTSSLRAILYVDEVLGYLPPVAEPPSKRPLLTMLKQARAFGVGVVLATQNTVDLDYKALANAGTWLIGRLQTERDRDRVLDGLEGAAAESQAALDRSELGRAIGSLEKREFLLHNVHDEGPVVFRSRWAMSYLRGPLTRHEIARLMDGRKPASTAAAPPAAAPAAATTASGDGAQRAREARDATVSRLRAKYAPRLRRAQEKLRKAEQRLAREEEQVTGAAAQTAVSIGATILDALVGRRAGRTTIGRGTTAARGAARTMSQRADVARAKDDVAAAQEELRALEEEFEQEVARLA